MADITLTAQYDQFFLFGDSITQDSYDQARGFGFSAALQAGQCSSLYLDTQESLLAYQLQHEVYSEIFSEPWRPVLIMFQRTSDDWTWSIEASGKCSIRSK
jgi:hypothetical protein